MENEAFGGISGFAVGADSTGRARARPSLLAAGTAQCFLPLCVGIGQGELHISGVEECVMNSKERVGPRISTKRCPFFLDIL